jgi:MFS transporter, putative metabolite:H+ symporter
MSKPSSKKINSLIIVAALGYFVDIYDLVLFSIVRISSLKSLGVSDDALMSTGIHLINMQMIGMLVGGIFWGILGDRKGRVSVLFGSIFLYSAANIANGFVTDVQWYGIIRFIAGVGLAGELGAGITLVSESMSKENRGYGTMIVATVGLLGAVAAALVGDVWPWQTAYFIGGGLGLLLLFLRIGVYESGMFESLKGEKIEKGNFLKLFSSRKTFFKYLNCILIGIPTWFVVGILVTFSPEIAKSLGVEGPVSAGKAIMYCYIGIALGDLVAGTLSQLWKTRKKVVFTFLLLTFASIIVYLNVRNISVSMLYNLCMMMGFATGYWAVFVTIASEHFGTNLRATVTTTVPNFVRGAVVPITLGFNFFKGHFGILNGATIVGVICLSLALISASQLHETYGKDLDYTE